VGFAVEFFAVAPLLPRAAVLPLLAVDAARLRVAGAGVAAAFFIARPPAGFFAMFFVFVPPVGGFLVAIRQRYAGARF
jgi:hypothetical protein